MDNFDITSLRSTIQLDSLIASKQQQNQERKQEQQQQRYLKIFSAKQAHLSSKLKDLNLKPSSNLMIKRQGFANKKEFSKSHEVSSINLSVLLNCCICVVTL